MAAVIYEDILEQVGQLKPSEQKALLEHLQAKWQPQASGRVTREMILAEMEQKRAEGAYENVESLRNKYASPNFENVTFKEIDDYLIEIGREWEEEIDRFYRED